MNKVKLSKIADVFTGYSFRSKLATEVEGQLLVQLKDISNDGTLDMSNLERIPEDNFKAAHYINEGDLVFRSRGQLLTAGVVPFMDEKVLLTSPLMKIVVDKKKALPEYLCWIINNTPGQSYFQSIAEGSAVKMVSKTLLMEMELIIPSLERQKEIVALASLQKKEAELCCEILKKREQLISTRIQRFIEED